MAIRLFRKKRGAYKALNVVGLSVGMAAVLLIGMYVVDELRVDRFHEHADRIVRIGMENEQGRRFSGPYPLGEALTSELGAMVEQSARTEQRLNVSLGQEATGPREAADVLFTEPSFFSIFSFEVVRGDAAAALGRPDGLVITASTAARLFGSADPIGQAVELGVRDFTLPMGPEVSSMHTVQAVLRDGPKSSTISFDMLAPIRSLPGMEMLEDEWRARPVSTYALLTPGTSAGDLEERARALVGARLAEMPSAPTPFVMPLVDIYLSDLHSTKGLTGQARYLLALGFAALFILGIAGINYVNLATAYGLDRAREIGVRKSVGAGAREIARSLLQEASVLGLIALGIAYALVLIVLPHFNDLTGTDLVLSDHGWTLALLSLFVMGVAALSAAYPALTMARVEPIHVLRGRPVHGMGGRRALRRSLVLVQLTACSLLLVGAFVMVNQLNYVRSAELGFDPNGVVLFELGSNAPMTSWEVLRTTVSAHPEVESAAVATTFPAWADRTGLVPRSALSSASRLDPEGLIEVGTISADDGFLGMLDLQLLAGRSWVESQTHSGILINETAARSMGWSPDEALGMPYGYGSEQTVTGVVADFHFTSLHDRIPAVSITRSEMGSPSVVGVRFATRPGARQAAEVQELLAPLTLTQTAPSYVFLDEHVRTLYAAERRLATIVSVFAGLGILVSCLGLFGLAALTTRQRAREVSIRRVFGGTIASVAAHLSREYVVLVVVALVLASVPAYWLMSGWLAGFAYRASLTALPFIAAGLLLLAVALVAVGYHVLRTATSEPAHVLKTD